MVWFNQTNLLCFISIDSIYAKAADLPKMELMSNAVYMLNDLESSSDNSVFTVNRQDNLDISENRLSNAPMHCVVIFLLHR
jgi:hypothetical protein